jgi:hypothetical protein
MIKHPIARNAAHGYKKLQTVLRIILLRRTKGERKICIYCIYLPAIPYMHICGRDYIWLDGA